jgi:glutamate formiminotransferase
VRFRESAIQVRDRRKVLRNLGFVGLPEAAMAEIVECVPNFSEGRRKEVVDELVAAIGSAAGVRVLDREMDASHNRCVITFVGDRTSVAEAAFRGARRAVDLIDMNRHHGEHPRVGALDVLPFVPIAGVTMDDCADLARAVGKRIADELHVPVYLYEAAATRPDRRALPDVRRGEYEGLKAEIGTDPDRKPDFGPAQLHPTAGACIVGVRPVLIAWNVNLRTKDVAIARRIAKAIRESDGGLPAVRAKGFELADRGLVQVSMNMVDYRRTSLVQAFEAIRTLAAKEGVEIAEAEIVGLVPLDALIEGATQYFKLARFHREQILETRLWE